jgi:prevent-host-death family protein
MGAYGHILVTMVMKTVSAATFKAKCLSLMDQVQAQRTELVITKRGKPVAKLVPVEEPARSIFGCMAGTFEIVGDLIEPLVDPSDWEANR